MIEKGKMSVQMAGRLGGLRKCRKGLACLSLERRREIALKGVAARRSSEVKKQSVSCKGAGEEFPSISSVFSRAVTAASSPTNNAVSARASVPLSRESA